MGGWTKAGALLFSVGIACGAAQTAAAPSAAVYRGLMTGGIWVELADDGQGHAELAVLDGLPGGPPQTQFVSLTRQEIAGCALTNPDSGVTVTPCPIGDSASVTITLGQASGRAALQSVGWEGSFAWPRAGVDLASIKKRCQAPQLAAVGGMGGSRFVSTLSTLRSIAAQISDDSASASDLLPRLRADRLNAYRIIALSSSETEAARDVADGVAGRPVNGRTIPLAEATREKLDFEAKVANNPQRKAARAELLRIDRQLGDVYDPVSSVRQVSVQNRLRRQALPAVRDGLSEALAARLPGSVSDLIALEQAVGEIDECATAMGEPAGFDAHALVRTVMRYRAPELAAAVTAAVQAAGDAASARVALKSFEANPAIRLALEQGGQGAAFAGARTRIADFAAAEERARLAGVRQAAAQLALDRVPPTTTGGRFQADRVLRSIVFVINKTPGQSTYSTGSGFIVAPDIVVTNVHVIEGSGNISVVSDGKMEKDALPASVIAQYPIHDMAILRVPGLTGRILSIAAHEPARGADVWAIGYPGLANSGITNVDVVATVTRGIVSRVVSGYSLQGERKGETRIIQHDAQFSSGNSGGPLIDACHRVVGINTQSASRADASRVLDSISTSILPELMRQAGVTPSISDAVCQ